MEAEKAYQEILELLHKHKGNILLDVDDIERISKVHIHAISLKEKHGLNINPKQIHNTQYQKLSENIVLGYWGTKTGRTISSEDNGLQPDHEYLLVLTFPTGGYIFCDDYFNNGYPKEIFRDFFNELKTYSPKYIDSRNKNLYFPIENASNVFNNYKSIFEKYRARYEEIKKELTIKELEKKIAELKS